MTAVACAAVIGCGSWGTALANHLCLAGHEVVITGNEPEVLLAIAQEHKNPKYFPSDTLCSKLKVALKLEEAISGADLVVFAVPSFAMRAVAHEAAPLLSPSAIAVSVAKGLEGDSFKIMTDVLREELGKSRIIAALSGPSFAQEVLRGLPTCVTVAASSHEEAIKAGRYFHHDNFRIYTSTDLVGVELGGAIKNIMALAAGVADGMEMGNNARAAIITRGIAEMQRLIVAVGGDARTVAGLSGLGDLLLTATGDLSRNRRVGVKLGKGEKLKDIVASLGQVAEAVETTAKALKLAARHQVETPIIELVNALLQEKISAHEAVKILLSREPRAENENITLVI